jgi:outer membrane protein assembly factor BamB
MKDSGKKTALGLKILKGFLIIIGVIILIPVIAMGLSFIGRIAPDEVIPDSFALYARVPNPVKLAERLLAHESLPEVLALPELAPLLPGIEQFRSSGIQENNWTRFALRGRLDAALMADGKILGAWDAGILSPLLRVLPFIAGRVSIKGLYYVQAGKNSRFEYRTGGGAVFYVGPSHNLLIISNDSNLFESVLGGTSRDEDRRGRDNKIFYAKNFDVAFLLSPDYLKEILKESDPMIVSVLGDTQFQDAVEAAVTIEPKQLGINIATSVSSNSRESENLLIRNSPAVGLNRMLPDSAQYATILAAGPLRTLMDAAASIPGAGVQEPWNTADSSSRRLLGMNIEELLYSWTGEEFAIFGMAGRPNPVILIEVKDEKKRQEVFNKAFKSIVLNENINLNLDGNRLPRIEMPVFLNSLLLSMGVRIPSPYYTIHNGYLFLSESAESLLAAVNAVRKNETLIRTDLWQGLAKPGPGKSSFGIFYSLDRSLPFFLRGNAMVSVILRAYRQGLVQLSLEKNRIDINLQAVPGSGRGLIPVQGYPFDLGGRAGNRVYAMGRGNDGRILLTKDNGAVSINALDKSIREFSLPGNLWIIPAEGIQGAVWIVSSQGRVVLADRDLEPLKGFPLITSIRVSAPPASQGGKLFLSDTDGSVHTIDDKASITKWGEAYGNALRSPPSFLTLQNKTFAAAYPKSFLGEIWIQDISNGAALPGWPAYISGIAFGSPLPFTYQNKLHAAFISQAGELYIYDEQGMLLQNFPLELDGVFYLQPVFDGTFLWIIAQDGTLYQISPSGDRLSQKIPNLEVKENGYITVADVDGNKEAEIFISGEGNALHGYNRNFQSLEGFPLPVWGRPAFADLSGNGKMEIIGAGMDNKIYRWQFR